MTEEKQHKILTNAYPSLTETKSFNTTSGRLIPARESFVYLGSLIHFTLRDTYDMDRRIVKAGQMMGALRFFWSQEEIHLGDKVHITCVYTLHTPMGSRDLGHDRNASKTSQNFSPQKYQIHTWFTNGKNKRREDNK